MKWLYTHVFKGIGLVILAGAATVLALGYLASCASRTPADEDSNTAEARAALAAQHGDPDAEIRRYQQRSMEGQHK